MLLISQDLPRKTNSRKELCRDKLLTSILSEPLQDIASFRMKSLCILSHGKPARCGLTRSWVRTNLRHLVIERPPFRDYSYRDPLGFDLETLLSPSQHACTGGDQHPKSGFPRPSNYAQTLGEMNFGSHPGLYGATEDQTLSVLHTTDYHGPVEFGTGNAPMWIETCKLPISY